MKKTVIRLGVLSVAAVAAWAVVSCTTGDQAKATPKFNYKDPTKPGVAAKIGDVEVSDDELIGDARMEIMNREKEIYQIKIERLKKVIEEKVISKEAQAKKMTMDEYVEKELLKGKLTVSDAEYKAFVKERKIPETNITDDIKGKINEYLKGKKKADAIEVKIAEISKKTNIEVYFKEPNTKINVEMGDAVTKGDKGAKVTIVEFSDFQCPYCKKGADVTKELIKKYGNKIYIGFKHYPLPFHTEAKKAAMASECANEQGKFWEMHDALFASQAEFKDGKWDKIAEKVGVKDIKKFNDCVSTDKFAAKMDKHMEEAKKLGINAVPNFFINGRVLAGAMPIEEFTKIIDEELAK